MPRKKSITDDGSDIEQFGTIFDQMGIKDPTNAPPEPTQAPMPDVSALLAKIDALSGTVNALASRPTPQPSYVPVPQASQSPSWEWADPGLEPERFGATLAQYTTYVIEQREASKQAELERTRSQSQQAQGLWDDFKNTYAEYADKGDQVGYAYQKVTGKLAERGVNVQEYSALRRAELFKAVAEEYNTIFGKPGKVETDDDADDSNRTSGIFGGFESGGQPSKGKEAAGDMIKDLKDMQRATGFF